MSDDRPLFSAAPDAFNAALAEAIGEIKPVLDRAFAVVRDGRGNPSERANDALSLLSELSAFCGTQLVGRLMEAKKIKADIALDIALGDIALGDIAYRIAHHIRRAASPGGTC